jgi:hypothetical protein
MIINIICFVAGFFVAMAANRYIIIKTAKAESCIFLYPFRIRVKIVRDYEEPLSKEPNND